MLAVLLVGVLATPGIAAAVSSGSDDGARTLELSQAASGEDKSAVLGSEGETTPSYHLVAPDEFERRMSPPGAYVINVHTPYEGEIEGTTEFIPYYRIKGDPRLPSDKGKELLLYCRSGRMSKEAADTLLAEGYTNIWDLEGGMDAWQASGRQIVQHPEHAPDSL